MTSVANIGGICSQRHRRLHLKSMTAQYGQWLDAVGTAHARAEPNARIACLVPSITELVCVLGLAPQLVARTGFCVHPREALRSVPKVGGTKDVEMEKLRAQNPTHVIVNIDENRRETAAELATFIPHVIVTHPLGPLDNLALYRLLGGIFGREVAAEALCADFNTVLGATHARGQAAAHQVLYLIWRDPWMTVSRDTYISRTLALFNWWTAPLVTAERYPVIELEDYAGNIELVLLSSEPYSFRQRHVDEVRAKIPGADVRLINGEMTSWYGSRAIKGLRYLADFTAASATSAVT